MNENTPPARTFSPEELGWEPVRALVGRYIGSPLGAAELAHVAPQYEREPIVRQLAEAGEAIRYLRAASGPQPSGQGAAIRIDFNGLPDVAAAIRKLHIEGAALEPREIFDLIFFLDRAADAASFLTAAAERFPLLGERVKGIGDFRLLLKELAGKIQGDGTVLDSASPHLHRVRREIEKQKKSIQDSLERFLRANRDEGVLQEEYVTIRNERFVVPVIAGQRRKLPGVIHGASSTGQTLFLEPLETIDLNNELVRLQEEESREVFRILRELTNRLREYGPPIRSSADVMATLDLTFAKARFAIEFDCAIPAFGTRFHVENARHPLLIDVLRKNGRKVIPFSLTMGGKGPLAAADDNAASHSESREPGSVLRPHLPEDQNCRVLLISGPNTGGKTVALKTIGLISLMAQAGLPVPCSVAELPLFEQVLADIGASQSIEQNLSTFSAHVSKLREMAFDVTSDSLVLLDEIGSATDPEEGGALGVALVDHFRAAGAFTVASTHLTALKIYGANTRTVLNASMGFDEQTLAPTYQLQTGLPGKSAALEIAARLGMPEDILKRARASLSSREIELSELIANLHKSVAEADRLRDVLERERTDLAAREKQIASDWERRETAKLNDLQNRFEDFQSRWQERADHTVARIAETAEKRKAADQAQRESARFKREMREEWETLVHGPDGGPSSDKAPRKLKIEEGVRVRLKGIREPARVRRILGEERFEVEAGFMKMQVSADDVEEILPETAAANSSKLPKNVRFQSGPELNPLVREINVIGEHAQEAVERVEKFLDAAVMATASRVRIVHGHGMGILKRAIQDLLKDNPHVEKYYAASQHEGGTGATIVELKE